MSIVKHMLINWRSLGLGHQTDLNEDTIIISVTLSKELNTLSLHFQTFVNVIDSIFVARLLCDDWNRPFSLDRSCISHGESTQP